MERDGALHQVQVHAKGFVDKVWVEFQIDVGAQIGKQPFEGIVAAKLIGGPHIGEGTFANVFQFQAQGAGALAFGTMGARVRMLRKCPLPALA